MWSCSYYILLPVIVKNKRQKGRKGPKGPHGPKGQNYSSDYRMRPFSLLDP